MSRAEQKMVDTMVRTEEPIFETDSGLRAHYVNGTVLLLTMTHHGWEAWDTYSDLSACVEAIADWHPGKAHEGNIFRRWMGLEE